MVARTTYKELIVTIIQSLDLINSILKNHHRRTAIIAYHLGREYGLSDEDLRLLVMSASVHDIGALTIKERDELLKLDVEDPYPHSILGSVMLEDLPYFENISTVIMHHHLKWKYAYLLEERFVNICSILHLSDRIDILIHHESHNKSQFETIAKQLEALNGTTFQPHAFETFLKCGERDFFWLDIDHMSMQRLLSLVLTDAYEIELDLKLLEKFAMTLSRVIDYRSEFTATHSQGVSAVAYLLAQLNGFGEDDCIKIKIAGLLHDIGKIGISNEIINKNGALSSDEYDEIRAHTYYTYDILSSIPGIKEIALWAASHHEKQDGSGYPFKLMHDEVSLEAAILAFSDVFTALAENRPYRAGLPLDEVLEKIDIIFAACEYPALFELMKNNKIQLDETRKTAQLKSFDHYNQLKIQKLPIVKDQ